MSIKIKNNISSELNINHTDGESAVTLESSELKQGSVGVGQTWQDVSGSRASGVTYTNNTGKPIEVSIRCVMTGSNVFATVNVDSTISFVSASKGTTSYQTDSITFVVPAGSTYELVSSNIVSINLWNELR